MNAIIRDDLADLSSFYSHNNTKRKLEIVINLITMKNFRQPNQLYKLIRDPQTEGHVLLIVSHTMAWKLVLLVKTLTGVA